MSDNSDSDSETHPLSWNECIETMYDMCAEIAHPRNRKYDRIDEFYEMLKGMDAFSRALQSENA